MTQHHQAFQVFDLPTPSLWETQPRMIRPNMHPSSLLHHRSPLLIQNHPEAPPFLSCIPLEPRNVSAPAALNQLLVLCFLMLVRLFNVVFPGDMFIDGVKDTTDTVEPMVILCSPVHM